MTVSIAVAGVLQEPISTFLTTTSTTDCLSMAAGRSDVVTVIGIIVTNADTTTARLIEVWWTEDTTDRLIFTRSVPAQETVTVALDSPIKLFAKNTARKIRAKASDSSKLTVTLVTTVSSQSGNA